MVNYHLLWKFSLSATPFCLQTKRIVLFASLFFSIAYAIAFKLCEYKLEDNRALQLCCSDDKVNSNVFSANLDRYLSRSKLNFYSLQYVSEKNAFLVF